MKNCHLQSPVTPQKEHLLENRRTKFITEHTKKPQKISKKSLNSVLASVSEDVMLESPEGSIDISSISEVSDDNHLGESAESLIVSPNPVITPSSSETITPSNPTVLSIIEDKDEGGDVSVNRYASLELIGAKTCTIEAEMVVKHLRQARIQVLNSVNVDLQFKKLLDALINVVIEEFYGKPEERGHYTAVISWKAQVVFLSFVLWILAVASVFFFTSGVGISFSEPPPT